MNNVLSDQSVEDTTQALALRPKPDDAALGYAVEPHVVGEDEPFEYDEDTPPDELFAAFGKQLSATGRIYRGAACAGGLVIVPLDANLPPVSILKGAQLAPIIIDRMRVIRTKGVKSKGNTIPNAQLTLMLGTESFLGQFPKTNIVAHHTPLGILGAACPDQWLSPGDLAETAMGLGLVDKMMPPADRKSDCGRERGMGVLLTAHRDETFSGETNDKLLKFVLEKKRARFDRKIETRYRFRVLAQSELPVDPEVENPKEVGDAAMT